MIKDKRQKIVLFEPARGSVWTTTFVIFESVPVDESSIFLGRRDLSLQIQWQGSSNIRDPAQFVECEERADLLYAALSKQTDGAEKH